MSDIDHSPEPWTPRLSRGSYINGARIVDRDGVVVGGVTSAADKSLHKKAADLKLMAAAPMLYAALQTAAEWMRGEDIPDSTMAFIYQALAAAEPPPDV